ncbi:MAG TPA: ABC transporter permease [Longimicrobiales bacterium]|nr:ABC transporter permease [Longimicrobiales bacterium]
MSRTWPVIKREFTEMVRTKAYVLGTLLGPLIIVAFIGVPLLFLRAGGGGERHVRVLDATGTLVGEEIAATLNATSAAAAGQADLGDSRFVAEARAVTGSGEEERRSARQEVSRDGSELDGFLFLAPDFMESGRALYEGRNATSVTQMGQLRSMVTQVVRTRRLNDAGVTPEVLAQVLRPVSIDARKPGAEDEEGAEAETAPVIGMLMAMAVYFAVALFAASVMRGVLEEKRDRIVEVLLSSVPARNFMFGKVLGIGAASLLQMLVWVGFAAAALTFGPGLARSAGLAAPALPQIPASVGVVFLFFFATGFLLYAAMFGAAGAIATTDQEANQLQFPVTIPLLIGFFMMYTLMADAESAMAVAGSLIPFTAPVVLPMRSMMTDIPTGQYIGAVVLMLLTVWGIMVAAAKIYRIGVLSTGKKPTLQELGRWLRTT